MRHSISAVRQRCHHPSSCVRYRMPQLLEPALLAIGMNRLVVATDAYTWERRSAGFAISRRFNAPCQATICKMTRDELSEAAIHEALEKLTKTKNTRTSRVERVQFWLRWWEENARRIVLTASK